MSEADKLLSNYVLQQYRYKNGWPSHGRNMQPSHLAICPSTHVIDLDAHDGTYGCDTGCEYYRLEATIQCDHEKTEFRYGNFGELSYLLEDLQEYEDRSIELKGVSD